MTDTIKPTLDELRAIAREALHGASDGCGAEGYVLAGWHAAARAMRAAQSQQAAPIDMVLHCRKCGLQHIDAPEDEVDMQCNTNSVPGVMWANPPHRSHLCHGCGHIWRPADVPTNGVKEIKTKGKADSPLKQEGTDAHSVTVDGKALRQLLEALIGPSHLIRELQSTRNLHTMGYPNPIEILRDQFNAHVKNSS